MFELNKEAPENVPFIDSAEVVFHLDKSPLNVARPLNASSKSVTLETSQPEMTPYCACSQLPSSGAVARQAAVEEWKTSSESDGYW
jgi:hypothetical protein